ncbi:hypothetical protein JCM19233_1174 [Vibrio astriarenae]|nr:hypothetical protein JCM19233_1174 [Vibrio sp. C7]
MVMGEPVETFIDWSNSLIAIVVFESLLRKNTAINTTLIAK